MVIQFRNKSLLVWVIILACLHSRPCQRQQPDPAHTVVPGQLNAGVKDSGQLRHLEKTLQLPPDGTFQVQSVQIQDNHQTTD